MARRRPDSAARKSRAEQVAADIEDEILEARLPVGAHLGRRAEFMERFGISPTVMNETLRILRNRGLVGVRPGAGGGIFVASLPPQVRLGAMDLWFHDSGTHPLQLFEARMHLEAGLAAVAFDRATTGDVDAIQDAYDRMASARDAHSYVKGTMRMHRALVTAARIPVLDGMHQSVVALLEATLSRATFIDGHEAMLRHSLNVHSDIIEAIRTRNRFAFERAMKLHNDDLIRTNDPHRSPDIRKISAVGTRAPMAKMTG
ncbi:FadR/GntR family transcriptional regulator [Protofrankia coriariae]|uniref:GntR family transcriptional regulator n=1 Tax=Protofrankia coriariae TaxID=1562887 RepID=A0ABR5F5R8_9ACTN|nr:FCD domain-containing protein [Protofrankia coriariae]KLL11973.1 GntR family transcriptional regulator [Protofrankia coriariae]